MPLRFLVGREYFNRDDFFKPDPTFGAVLDTSELQCYLEAWQKRVLDVDEARRAEAGKGANDMLKQTGQIVHSLFRFLHLQFDREQFLFGPHIIAPLSMIHFAGVLMHHALWNACSQVLDIPSPGDGGRLAGPRLPFLKWRMKDEGWCPHMVQRLHSSYDVDEVVYAYALGTVRTKDDHSLCSGHACAANNTSDSIELPVKHVSEHCVSCPTVQTPAEDILRIIQQGAVPALRAQTRNCHEAVLSATSMTEGDRYVAISHLWADRLGSVTSNSIARCQVTRITEQLNSLQEGEESGNLRFWMDTLCIPVGAEHQELRDSQISRMHEIYKRAYAVVVIDADTLALSQLVDFTELAMRLVMSAWISRLWTYQEGSLNNRLMILASDGLIDLDAKIKSELYRDRVKDPPQHKVTDKMIRATVLALGRPQHHSSRPSGIPLTKEHGDYALHYMARNEGDLDAQKTLQAIGVRTSSRCENESVIIGATLGLDLWGILKAPAEERMAAFLKALPCIPGNLIFCVGPRLNKPGFRWAPSTVIRSNGGYIPTIVDYMVPWDEVTTRMGGHLPRPLSKLDSEGRGLLSFNAAIGLRNAHRIHPDHPNMAISIFEAVYSFHATGVNPSSYDVDSLGSLHIQAALDRETRLAILIPEFDPENKLTCGVIVEILSDTKPIEHTNLGAGRAAATKAKFLTTVAFQEKLLGQVMRPVETEDQSLTPSVSFPQDLYYGIEELEQEVRWQARNQAEWLWPRFWLID